MPEPVGYQALKAAVFAKHFHNNKAVIDEFSEDGTGKLLYKGQLIEGSTGTGDGASIDDTQTAIDKTWSSNKISEELSNKADSGNIATVLQVVENNAQVGDEKDIALGDTNAKANVQIFKFIAAPQDQTIIKETFDNASSSSFDYNSNFIIFDGEMKIIPKKTSTKNVALSVLGNGKTGSFAISKSDYKTLLEAKFV